MGAGLAGFIIGLMVGGPLGFAAAAVVVVGREEGWGCGSEDE